MRQLKYRIWDNQNRRWITENGYSLHCNSNWAICPFTGKLTDYVSTIEDDVITHTASPANEYYLTSKGIVSEPRYIVVQCTGLKDSKGTEIYEGDIIKSYNTDTNTGEDISSIFEVYFDQSFCQFRLKHRINSYTMSSIEIYCEVIGNIFENPELLK